MKIGGIISAQDLGMITVQGAPDAPGIAGKILEAIGNSETSVGFISCAPDLGGGASITICVAMDRFERALDEIECVREEIHAQKVATQQRICSVSVFGPHFGEIPNVASRFFQALAEAGINILAISTSVSSVTCVFDQTLLTEGMNSLRGRFEIP
jgi:aspartate kinase